LQIRRGQRETGRDGGVSLLQGSMIAEGRSQNAEVKMQKLEGRMQNAE
jgi:hypothetical protein